MSTILLSVIALRVNASDYNYNNLGNDWTGICASGTRQSPINIASASSTFQVVTESDMLQKIEIDYSCNDVQATNDGDTVVFTDDWGSITWDQGSTDSKYNPIQFHFHAPSEHQYNGVNYDLELHIVHQLETDSNQYGVVAIFFDSTSDKSNDFIEATIDAFDSSEEICLEDAFDGIETIGNFYNYQGSFTTPPCTEAVNFFIMAQVQNISKSQLKQFTDLWAGNSAFAGGNGNNRAVKNLNGRTIYHYQGNDEDSAATNHLAAFLFLLALIQ